MRFCFAGRQLLTAGVSRRFVAANTVVTAVIAAESTVASPCVLSFALRTLEYLLVGKIQRR